MRPLIMRCYSKSALAAAKVFPVVGKYLLQRNVIKVGIPLVGIPLSVVVNRQTTLIVGRHARAVFRNEARIIEIADNLTAKSRHPSLMLWVAWFVAMAAEKASAVETSLLRHLIHLIQKRHPVIADELARLLTPHPP